jgi:hypothetical protein
MKKQYKDAIHLCLYDIEQMASLYCFGLTSKAG